MLCMRNRYNAKITQQHLIVLTKQHIFWLDVAMNQLFRMGIIQSLGNLSGIRNDLHERNAPAFGIALAQRPTRSIVHDQVRNSPLDVDGALVRLGPSLYPKLQHAYNMRTVSYTHLRAHETRHDL